LEKFFPARLKPANPKEVAQLQTTLEEKWVSLRVLGDDDCRHIYLENISDWPHFCATYFFCEVCVISSSLFFREEPFVIISFSFLFSLLLLLAILFGEVANQNRPGD